MNLVPLSDRCILIQIEVTQQIIVNVNCFKNLGAWLEHDKIRQIETARQSFILFEQLLN